MSLKFFLLCDVFLLAHGLKTGRKTVCEFARSILAPAWTINICYLFIYLFLPVTAHIFRHPTASFLRFVASTILSTNVIWLFSTSPSTFWYSSLWNNFLSLLMGGIANCWDVVCRTGPVFCCYSAVGSARTTGSRSSLTWEVSEPEHLPHSYRASATQQLGGNTLNLVLLNYMSMVTNLDSGPRANVFLNLVWKLAVLPPCSSTFLFCFLPASFDCNRLRNIVLIDDKQLFVVEILGWLGEQVFRLSIRKNSIGENTSWLISNCLYLRGA